MKMKGRYTQELISKFAYTICRFYITIFGHRDLVIDEYETFSSRFINYYKLLFH